MCANMMKSYKSHTVTDRVIDQNKNNYNYEQYEQSSRFEAFHSLAFLRFLFKKKYLYFKTLSLIKDL